MRHEYDEFKYLILFNLFRHNDRRLPNTDGIRFLQNRVCGARPGSVTMGHGRSRSAGCVPLRRLPRLPARLLRAPQRAAPRHLPARVLAQGRPALAELPEARDGRRPQPHGRAGAALRRGVRPARRERRVLLRARRASTRPRARRSASCTRRGCAASGATARRTSSTSRRTLITRAGTSRRSASSRRAPTSATSPKWIAKTLLPAISESQAKKALSVLHELGLLVEGEDGRRARPSRWSRRLQGRSATTSSASTAR